MSKRKQGAPNVATFATLDVSIENDVGANAAGRGAVVLGKLATCSVVGGEAEGPSMLQKLVADMSIPDLLSAAFDLEQLALHADSASKMFTNIAVRRILAVAKEDGMDNALAEISRAMSQQGLSADDQLEVVGEALARVQAEHDDAR